MIIQRTRHRKLHPCSETYKGFVVLQLIKNNLVCIMNILAERWMEWERKSRYMHQVVFHNRRPEVVHRKMTTTKHHDMGCPTHMADGHSFYADMDGSLKLTNEITIENQRLCAFCDENEEECVPNTPSLVNLIEIILPTA